ncbi:MAG: hypothetical protein M3N98_07970, partial [Actinomycetota bacterium]|nr:hypothetical protein [Actinomycetota bacterium]
MTLTRTGGRTAPRPPRTGAPDEPWTLLADILLQRAALIARMTRNRALDPMAGLKVDGDDIEYLIRELPGIEAVDPPGVAELARSLVPEVEQARAELANDLASEGSFAWLVFSAQLDAPEAEVLAVMCAVELDPRRQRLVGYLNDDVTQRRLTPWSLGLVFNQDLGAHLAVGPGSRLRRAALLVPPADGPWATTPLTVAPAVLWWLSGDHSLDPDLPPGVEVVSGPGGSASLITAAGPDRVRRLQAAVAALRGESFLVTPVPGTPERWDAVIRQATLAQLGVILDVEDGLSPDARDRIERADHLAWAVTSPRDLPLVDLPRRPWIDVAVRPGAATVEEWSATFGRAANHEEYRLT